MTTRAKVVTEARTPPRISPGGELTMTVDLSKFSDVTWTTLEVVMGQEAIQNIEVEGLGDSVSYNNKTHKISLRDLKGHAIEFVIYFKNSINDLLSIKDNGLHLKLRDCDTINSGKVVDIFQPVLIDSLSPIPTVISRKDSVPTQYTHNIERLVKIRETSENLKFENYQKKIDDLLCQGNADETFRGRTNELLRGRALPFTGDDAYRVLKAATEAFLLCYGTAELKGDSGAGATVASRIGAINQNSAPPDDYNNDQGTRYFQLVYARLPNEALKKQVFPALDPKYGQLDFLGTNNDNKNLWVHNKDDQTRRSLVEAPRTCIGVLQERMQRPVMVELIWSYWHEQAMLAQTMYAIRNRVQNVSENAAADPLAHLEIGPLRPLNTLLWTYIQDEQHRLTVSRRNFEYEHQYGLSLRGKALQSLQAVDRRSKFLDAFHNLLYLASVYFKEDDDTNRKADAFPILHALKEVHFLLSEGAHNQFGELPVTARVEMMIEQWLLARPEFQRFLPTRESIAYPEAWMGSVDAMKSMQGWPSTSVIYFSDLARFGEILLLSIRFDAWSEISDRDTAANWAKTLRNYIQGYTYAYRIVTSVDLQLEPSGAAAEVRRRDPALLIQQRWEEQRRSGSVRPAQTRITPAPSAGSLPSPRRPV